MPTLKHLVRYFQENKSSQKPLYYLCIMILFWSVYDGAMSFLAPLAITAQGFSATLMGIIIGTSSIAGALFDFITCRIFKNTNYRKIFLIMFACCSVYPLILYKAHAAALFIFAMALWGVYFDLKNIGNFDYVGRYTPKEKHSASFGLVQVFLSLGYLIAPIMIGAIVAESLDWKPFAAAWIFLAIAFIFFIILTIVTRRHPERTAEERKDHHRTTWSEIVLWGKIGRILFPVLLLTLFLNLIDGFFWTVGPLFAESLSGVGALAGFFMTAYSLPALLVGWFVGTFTHRFGKKRTASLTLLVGSLILTLIYFAHSPISIIATIFCASLFISMSWPAINGAYADYISETEIYEKEIAGLEDFYTNVGYVIGPMAAGFLADRLGNNGTFTFLGACGIVLAFYLFLHSRRHINVARELNK